MDATPSRLLEQQEVTEEQDTKAGIITMPHLRKRRAQHVYPVPRGAEEKVSHCSLLSPALTTAAHLHKVKTTLLPTDQISYSPWADLHQEAACMWQGADGWSAALRLPTWPHLHPGAAAEARVTADMLCALDGSLQ